MTTIEKIRAEILRLICPYETMAEVIAYKEAIDDVTLILDTLEEPVCDDKKDLFPSDELELEIIRWMSDELKQSPQFLEIPMTARHFAEWQKAQDDKMVDIIYQQGIEKGKDEMREQQPACEDLEKEAVSYCFDNGLNLSPRVATDFARHFANWQKEQMMKEAVEGEYDCQYATPAVFLDKYLDDVKDGDKVRIIILPKEDEE
jgi:hypothetical protein